MNDTQRIHHATSDNDYYITFPTPQVGGTPQPAGGGRGAGPGPGSHPPYDSGAQNFKKDFPCPSCLKKIKDSLDNVAIHSECYASTIPKLGKKSKKDSKLALQTNEMNKPIHESEGFKGPFGWLKKIIISTLFKWAI